MKIIRPITINDSILTSSNVPETDYSAWNSGTTYSAAQRCIVTTPNVHKIYESLAGGNLNHDPVVDCALAVPLYWKKVSSTNRWKAFDGIDGSRVSQATSIIYQITPGLTFDSIAFLNLDAASVEIKLTDPTDGVVYDKIVSLLTTTLTGTSSIYDWYTYFFSSITKISDFAKFDIPPYLNAVLDITITNTSGTAKVGEIVLGLQTNIGITQYNLSIGILDYSQKTVDAYGVYSVTPGPFSKRLTCDFTIPNVSIDDVQNTLALYRATPLVYVGAENYSSLIIYGYYRDFTIVVPYPTYSICTIEIEGLT